MVAVTLRQSLQLQTWVFTKPSPSTACCGPVSLGEVGLVGDGAYDFELHGAAVAGCCRGLGHYCVVSAKY